MLNWQMITKTLFEARTDLFRYTIEPVDGRFHWSLEVAGQYVGSDGPYNLDRAKAAAEIDYKHRITHAEKVIENGGYVQAD